MRIIHAAHPTDFKHYDTSKIRDRFLLNNLVEANKINCVYTHYDRMITGAAMPVNQPLQLNTYDELKSEYFLQRRELGIINIGHTGTVTVNNTVYELDNLDCLYIGKGKENVVFNSNTASNPAKFILMSSPAHKEFDVQLMKQKNATPAELGSSATANHRIINKYIHADGLQSCQLVMGVTNFIQGSVWNTMPCHTHERRMEIYFYFNIPAQQTVLHIMGEPQETRHLFIANEEAIVSPPWSVHSGVGTASYSFIWAMAGENMAFTDMDAVAIQDLK